MTESFKNDCILKYNYTSIAELVRAYYQYRKERKPSWSYAQWARMMGLKGDSSLIKVSTGKRAAGAALTEALERYFEFTGAQKNYLRFLIVISDPQLGLDEDFKLKIIEFVKAECFSNNHDD